jgi:hypothetical protein
MARQYLALSRIRRHMVPNSLAINNVPRPGVIKELHFYTNKSTFARNLAALLAAFTGNSLAARQRKGGPHKSGHR